MALRLGVVRNGAWRGSVGWIVCSCLSGVALEDETAFMMQRTIRLYYCPITQKEKAFL